MRSSSPSVNIDIVKPRRPKLGRPPDTSGVTDGLNTVAARIALVAEDDDEAQEVATRFEELEIRDPYFREIRHQVVAKLRDPQQPAAEEVAGLFASIWRMAIRYLLVQPNIFGFGVNVSAILNDAAGGSTPSNKGPRGRRPT